MMITLLGALFFLLLMLCFALALFDEFTHQRSKGRPRRQVMHRTFYSETNDRGFAG